MKQLKISTAGVRGVVGQGMDAEVAMSFAQAFSTYFEGGKIAVCRDTRPSAQMMRSAVLSGLLSCGSKVIDLGVVPSPSLRLILPNIHADGAIVIAAGHNPAEWNALKFIRGDGMYLSARQGQELLEIYDHGEFLKAGWERIERLEFNDTATELHLERILATFQTDVVHNRHFKVAVDCCNGACCSVTPRLLEAMGCEVVALNADPDRPLPVYPNPTPDNMSQLEALVKAAGADIGFAHDAEGERLGIVTEKGVALVQEMTLAVACWIALETGWCQKPIVTNLSTSRVIDRIAAKFGIGVIRTSVGQSYVSEQALLLDADIAGEGCGQVTLPRFHPGPDGVAVIAFVLEYLARTGVQISELVARLPAIQMIRENVSLAPNEIYRKLQELRVLARSEFADFSVDLTDGVKLEAEDGWIHVRASSTESMLRIIVEGDSQERVKELHRWIRDLILE